MTPREHRAFDARIATALGWTDVRQSPDPTPEQFGGKEFPVKGNGSWWGWPPAGFASEWGTKIPPFSSDWEAAKIVVDRMNLSPAQFRLFADYVVQAPMVDVTGSDEDDTTYAVCWAYMRAVGLEE